jgi:Carboxypeptidase regulatory-like domain
MKFWIFSICLLSAGLLRASTYKEINLTDGGVIKGKVLWKSPHPTAQTIPVTKDQTACGQAKTLTGADIGKAGSLANAVIYLDGITAGKKIANVPKVTLDQKNCEYIPHVLIVPPNAEIEFRNSDAAFHNVHTYNLTQKDAAGRPSTIFNLAFPFQGHKVTKKLTAGSNVLSLCDGGHPWMSAHIFLTEHPYYALTGADGTFVIDNVPPGKYTLRLWHEGIPTLENNTNSGFLTTQPKEESKQVSVGKNQTVTINFEL